MNHFHTNLNFDKLCWVPVYWFPDLVDHEPSALCKGRKQTMEAIFPAIFLSRESFKRLSLVAWLHIKMGLWQFQFSELCCVQMCFQKVWTSNWIYEYRVICLVCEHTLIITTHVVCLWQWSANWLAWFSFYVSLCIQANHDFC